MGSATQVKEPKQGDNQLASLTSLTVLRAGKGYDLRVKVFAAHENVKKEKTNVLTSKVKDSGGIDVVVSMRMRGPYTDKRTAEQSVRIFTHSIGCTERVCVPSVVSHALLRCTEWRRGDGSHFQISERIPRLPFEVSQVRLVFHRVH